MRLIVILTYLGACCGYLWLCRCFSIFFDEARCQIGFRIKNSDLCWLLIATETKPINCSQSIGATFQNANKLSLVGLLAHLVVDPLCLFTLVCTVISLFSSGAVWDQRAESGFLCATVAVMFFVVVDAINNKVRLPRG